MFNKTGFFTFLLSVLFCVTVSAQVVPKRDSLYHKIENFSKKSKISKMLYNVIFRNIPDGLQSANTASNDSEKYKDKYIRNIYIKSYDPFGNNLKDEKKESKWYEKAGNRLHRNTRNFAVRGYLLFKEGDRYNVQKLYESERILRDTKFISRVNISPVDSTMSADSVDISVKVLDTWSLKPLAAISGRRMGIGISEENFLGYGHEATAYYRTDFKTKQKYYLGSYTANNIYGSYINAKILMERDFDRNETVYFRADRPFVSALMKWGGGLRFDFFKRWQRFPIATDTDPETFPWATLKGNSQDVWGGYQMQLGKNSEGKVTDNIIIAARFKNTIIKDHPGEAVDPGAFFQSNYLALGSVEYTKRKFEVKKNVFGYDLPEDIPYGAMFSATAGYMKPKTEEARPYAGVAAGYGLFTKAGYFNYKVQYGTFFRESKNYMSTFRLDGTYFSPLRDYKAFNVRHFLSETLVVGNNRNATYADRTSLNELTEFPEFSREFLGRDKFILRYQLQFFIKKPWKNFQINPYVMSSFGWLSTDQSALFSSKVNLKLGIGVHFYNPFLAFNRFQLSFVYYPRLPFADRSAYDFNGYKNYYMPLQSFIPSEPSDVNYRN